MRAAIIVVGRVVPSRGRGDGLVTYLDEPEGGVGGEKQGGRNGDLYDLIRECGRTIEETLLALRCEEVYSLWVGVTHLRSCAQVDEAISLVELRRREYLRNGRWWL